MESKINDLIGNPKKTLLELLDAAKLETHSQLTGEGRANRTAHAAVDLAHADIYAFLLEAGFVESTPKTD